jgi:hypothetical protein
MKMAPKISRVITSINGMTSSLLSPENVDAVMFPFAWVTNIDDREPGIVIGQLGRITYYFDCSSKTERLYRAKLLRI